MASNKIEGEKNLTNRGRGRPKGSQNKTTRLAKEAIEKAAEGLGGVDRMIAWAKEDPSNEKVFWSQMYTKLLPVQVAGDPDNPIKTEEVGAASAKLAAYLDTIAERSGTSGE